MGRISLWNPVKGADYRFIDRTVNELYRIAGDGILVHMYEGPTSTSTGSTDTSLTTIQDVLFLTNLNRIYNPNVIELKMHHVPQDITYDLSQFGVMLSNTSLRITMHFNDMMDALGRKLIAGDVLEFPSLADTPIFNDAVGINRYYVVQTALYSAPGYGQKWFPHMWLVTATAMTAGPEFTEITDQAATGQTAGGVGQGIGIMPDGFTSTADANGNPGTGPNPSITASLNLFASIIGISEQVVAEAQQYAFFDPKFFESANLYIYIDPKTNYPILGSWTYFSGTGTPPNTSTDPCADLVPSGPLVGAGISFPTDMTDGQYYLRLDYYPERLFQKQGNVFKLIEVNVLKSWTAYNRVLDTFIDNINCTVLPDGTVQPEKQPLSTIIKEKVDLYAARRQRVLSEAAAHTVVANEMAVQNVIAPGSAITGLDSPYPTSPTST
jgi:hypothetical protein